MLTCPLRLALSVLFVTSVSVASAIDAASVYAKAKGAVVTIRTDTGSGTGFVVGDGTLVLTCWHVVKDADWVRTDETGSRSVAVVGHDSVADVALLRLTKPIRRTLALRSGAAPPPGTKVYALGTPLGYLSSTITEGIVSGKRLMGDVAYLQITAPVSHGSSGGPVLDESGRVVGMVDFGDEKGHSLNFAVSSYNIRRAMETIRKDERIAISAAKIQNAKDSKNVVGRVARAVRDTVLRSEPGLNADAVCEVSQGAYILARWKGSNGWVPIIMSDRRLAFARAEDVFVLDRLFTEAEVKKLVAQTKRRNTKTNLSGEAIARLAITKKGQSFASSGEFVAVVYALYGYDLTSEPAEQAKRGTPVQRLEDLRAGDRLYFYGDKVEQIDEVAIYLGGGYAMSTDRKNGRVATLYLDENRRKVLVAARRGAPVKEKPSITDPYDLGGIP